MNHKNKIDPNLPFNPNFGKRGAKPNKPMHHKANKEQSRGTQHFLHSAFTAHKETESFLPILLDIGDCFGRLMGRRRLQGAENANKDVVFSCSSVIRINQMRCTETETASHGAGGFFASVGQVASGFGVTPSLQIPIDKKSTKLLSSTYMKYMVDAQLVESQPEALDFGEDDFELGLMQKKKKKSKIDLNLKLKKIKIGNASVRRLLSGAIAGVVSRTAVAPLETIRIHLMAGSSGHSTSSQVFRSILETDGWQGLFSGTLVNVIRVAPSKAIELFAYDTVKKQLTPRPGEELKIPIPIPASSIAGAVAGFTSTLCTYPLELLKTRLTVQRGVYSNFWDAVTKIVQQEGPAGLYRGLTPSLIGVIPYAAANYFAYDALSRAYKKAFKRDEIGNVTTLLIGSAAAAISSTATFPLEVARKKMQVGAVMVNVTGGGGQSQYKHIVDALCRILESEGIGGLYRGLGPSYMKLVPAAGISFMCYEACKRILADDDQNQDEM